MEINFDHHMMSLHEVRNRPGVNWVEVGYYLCNFYELKSRNTAERKKKREKNEIASGSVGDTTNIVKLQI